LNKTASSREERKAAGVALRAKCPRSSHAEWKAPRDRPDPLELLIESSRDRVARLVPIRYGRMMRSPFAYYRGAAAMMAADLAHTPVSGIRVQACGDCHLLNFGGFGTPERKINFDINDFDETLPAPWEWDVKRLAASFVLAARHRGFRESAAREAALRCVRSYRSRMQTYAEMSVLELWHQRIEMEQLLSTVKRREWKRLLETQIEKETSHATAEHDFPKLADVENGKVRIKDNPPLIFHQTELQKAEYDHLIHVAYRRYRDTLTDDLKTLTGHYELADVAVKVVGVGSVGTRCAILLTMADADDPLFLQIKEAHASVLEPYAGKSAYGNHGQRVVAGQKLMQAASDMFLGWTEEEGRHFYVRHLRDIKIPPLVEVFDEIALEGHGEWCGWALARAHAKSGDAARISGYLGKSDKFDDAMGRFAVSYADQTEKDFEEFLGAIRAGRIEVQEE
jgi:uncharacterized protein (DUF2252 family)